jgi:hypothetical protein
MLITNLKHGQIRNVSMERCEYDHSKDIPAGTDSDKSVIDVGSPSFRKPQSILDFSK